MHVGSSKYVYSYWLAAYVWNALAIREVERETGPT